MEIQKIFSRDKAIKLSDMGNKIIYTEPNKKFPNLQVFCFRNTEKFQNDWNSIR